MHACMHAFMLVARLKVRGRTNGGSDEIELNRTLQEVGLEFEFLRARSRITVNAIAVRMVYCFISYYIVLLLYITLCITLREINRKKD